MFARLDQNDQNFSGDGGGGHLTDVLPVFMSWQALHHLGLTEGHFAAQRSSYWDVRHWDSVVLDILPLSVPFAWPPPTRSRTPPHLRRWCFLSHTACVWSHPLENLACEVIFSVGKHERHVLFSSITKASSHACYWLLLYNSNQIWGFYDFKTCGNPKYVKLLHKYCVCFCAYLIIEYQIGIGGCPHRPKRRF